MLGYVVLFIGSVLIFVCFTTLLLPFLFLKQRCSIKCTKDRGIKKVKGKGFVGMVYLPEPAIRDTIDKYAIEETGEGKYLTCKLNDNVMYIDYDIVVFSATGTHIDVIHVKEIIVNKGQTQKIELPIETAYVLIHLNETNLREGVKPLKLSVKKFNIALYLLCSAIAVILEALVLKLCISNLFGGLFNESFMYKETFLVSGVIIAILTIVCIISFYSIVKRRNKG